MKKKILTYALSALACLTSCSDWLDLRPESGSHDPEERRLLVGRAQKLERLGLADPIGPASWTLKPGGEEILRALSIRGDIIKTMHAAMSRGVGTPDIASFAIHDEQVGDPVLGRLVELLQAAVADAHAA